MAMFKTKLGKAKDKGDYLKTTLPSGFVRQLQLKPGDELEWDLQVNDEGNFIFIITPVKKS